MVGTTAFWFKAPRLAAALGVQVRPGGAPNSGEMCLVFGYLYFVKQVREVGEKKKNELPSVGLKTAGER